MTKEYKFIPMNSWRHMARLGALRAHYLHLQGQNSEAAREAMGVVSLAHKIEQSQSHLIIILVGIAMKKHGLIELEHIMPLLPKEEKLAIADELEKYSDNTAGMVLAHKLGFLDSVRIVDYVAAGGEPFPSEGISPEPNYSKFQNNFYFKPNKTKNLYAEHARYQINDINNCGDKSIALFDPEYPELVGNKWKILFTENFLGRSLVYVSAVSLHSAHLKLCAEREQIQKIITVSK
jgi:hypothetical protein